MTGALRPVLNERQQQRHPNLQASFPAPTADVSAAPALDSTIINESTHAHRRHRRDRWTTTTLCVTAVYMPSQLSVFEGYQIEDALRHFKHVDT